MINSSSSSSNLITRRETTIRITTSSNIMTILRVGMITVEVIVVTREEDITNLEEEVEGVAVAIATEEEVEGGTSKGQ
jgi:hypothetical protein